METPKISCRWNPSLFAGWRRWSLLIFISLLLFFIASRVPLFSVEKNPALQAFKLFLGEAEKMQTAALISGQ